jgi:hypothetical protein
MADPAGAAPEVWERFWRKWPLSHLAGGGPNALFRLDGERMEPTFVVPDELGATFDAMVDELVEWRLAEYLLRPAVRDDGIVCTVSHAGGRPIIRIDRGRHPDLPEGPTEVWVGDERLELHFVKVAVNVARRPGGPAARRGRQQPPRCVARLVRPRRRQPWHPPRRRAPRDGARLGTAPADGPAGDRLVVSGRPADRLGPGAEAVALSPSSSVRRGGCLRPRPLRSHLRRSAR